MVSNSNVDLVHTGGDIHDLAERQELPTVAELRSGATVVIPLKPS